MGRPLLLLLVLLLVAWMIANRKGKRTQFNREMAAIEAIAAGVRTAETQFYPSIAGTRRCWRSLQPPDRSTAISRAARSVA